MYDRKRSRYYQSLMDSPVLKAGKKTRYKMLPSTVIIFITQEDIFGRDVVKYTFTEQCEEIRDLKLEDGTTKIFLNMTSKNGAPELVSMLQYMKETRIDNPEIVVKDSRLLELDEIVNEVKESKEWEAVKMNILEIGKEFGAKEKLKEYISGLKTTVNCYPIIKENKDYKILQKEYLLFEIQSSLDVNPISHRHKIKMNRIFREIVKNKVEISKIKLLFTTDLKQNGESLTNTLTEFKLDPETNKYKVENIELKLLGM